MCFAKLRRREVIDIAIVSVLELVVGASACKDLK